MHYRTLLLLAFGAFSVAPLLATDYYVDSRLGSDSADGLTPKTAWRSLDRVSGAKEIQPGDVVRFKSGEVFRGGLKPSSGTPDKPVVYTSYGKGLKPSFWRSVPLDKESDWVKVEDCLWATKPTTIRSIGDAGGFLNGGGWSLHQESGAKVRYSVEEQANGQARYRFLCEKTGSASNHVQWINSPFSIEKGAFYRLSFDIKASKATSLNANLMMKDSPWSGYGAIVAGAIKAGPESTRCSVVFRSERDASDARLTVYFGGIGDDVDIEIANMTTDRVEIDAYDFGPDVGNIILDGKKAAFKRWSIKDRTLDDGKTKLIGLNIQDDFCFERSEGRVWFYSKENPAKVYQSIEAAVMSHVVDHSNVHDVVFDGLDIRYGSAHGFGGAASKRLVIRNCDIAWIGGGDQYRQGGEGRRVRYGNGIEFWADAEDHLVEGCRIWEVYDAAITNQGSGVNAEKNIVYRNNLIWNCEYSFEYWNRDEESITENVLFEDNVCLYAGFGWGHEQRPDKNGRCLMFYSNTAQTKGFVVKNNIFANALESLVRSDKDWTPEQPKLDGNVYWQDPDAFDVVPPYVRWHGKDWDDKEFKSEYQEKIGMEKNGKIEYVDAKKYIPTDIR